MSKKKNMVNAVRKDFVDRAYDILELCNLVKNRQQASEIEREETMMQLRNIFDAAKQVITIDDGVVLWMNAHKPSVFTLIEYGRYKNTKPYPNRTFIAGNYAEYKAMLDAYYDEENRCDELFRRDLEREHDVKDNPKADLLWAKAWERGHANGHHEVASVYGDLVDLIK